MFRLIIGSFFAVFLLSATPQGHEGETGQDSYTGTWHEEKDSALQLIVERAGESIHVKESRGGKVLLDYTCRPDGKDCEFREEGHKGKVSLWFNAPYLVELRSRGETVTKRRYLVKDNQATLQVEVMPMTPAGQKEVLVYARTGETAQR